MLFSKLNLTIVILVTDLLPLMFDLIFKVKFDNCYIDDRSTTIDTWLLLIDSLTIISSSAQ